MMLFFAKKYKKFYKKFNQGKRTKKSEDKRRKIKEGRNHLFWLQEIGNKRPECPLKKKHSKKGNKNEELKKCFRLHGMSLILKNPMKRSKKKSLTSLDSKHYAFMIVDDFSRYILVLFLTTKDDALRTFSYFCKNFQNFAKMFKMHKVIWLLLLEVIMVENLTIILLN